MKTWISTRANRKSGKAPSAATTLTEQRAELELALSFVIHRIDRQANESGQPLSEEERCLLGSLPSSDYSSWWAPDLGPPKLVPKDLNLERLCALARAAYLADRQTNQSSPEWRFAFAVFTLNGHPVWGILRQAGLEESRSLADQLFLIAAGVVLVLGLMMAFLASLVVQNEPWRVVLTVAICLGAVVATVQFYFASRQIEKRRLKEEIEKCRLASSSVRIVGR